MNYEKKNRSPNLEFQQGAQNLWDGPATKILDTND
jgi:hypothetical protein